MAQTLGKGSPGGRGRGGAVEDQQGAVGVRLVGEAYHVRHQGDGHVQGEGLAEGGPRHLQVMV